MDGVRTEDLALLAGRNRFTTSSSHDLKIKKECEKPIYKASQHDTRYDFTSTNATSRFTLPSTQQNAEAAKSTSNPYGYCAW